MTCAVDSLAESAGDLYTQGMPAKYVLRDLAGVADLESRLQRIETHPNPEWAPERDGLDETVDRLSSRLFGITVVDTVQEDPGDKAWDEWERHFKFLYDDDEEPEDLIWDAMGWDLSDGQGGMLLSAAHLARQIVCAAKGLRGRLPGSEISEAERVDRQADWAAEMQAAAQKFSTRARR